MHDRCNYAERIRSIGWLAEKGNSERLYHINDKLLNGNIAADFIFVYFEVLFFND